MANLESATASTGTSRGRLHLVHTPQRSDRWHICASACNIQRTHSLNVSSYMNAADGEQALSFAAFVSVVPVSCPALTDSEIRIGVPGSRCLSHTFRCADITWGSLRMGRKYACAWSGISFEIDSNSNNLMHLHGQTRTLVVCAVTSCMCIRYQTTG
jgi:hypothetical protein